MGKSTWPARVDILIDVSNRHSGGVRAGEKVTKNTYLINDAHLRIAKRLEDSNERIQKHALPKKRKTPPAISDEEVSKKAKLEPSEYKSRTSRELHYGWRDYGCLFTGGTLTRGAARKVQNEDETSSELAATSVVSSANILPDDPGNSSDHGITTSDGEMSKSQRNVRTTRARRPTTDNLLRPPNHGELQSRKLLVALQNACLKDHPKPKRKVEKTQNVIDAVVMDENHQLRSPSSFQLRPRKASFPDMDHEIDFGICWNHGREARSMSLEVSSRALMRTLLSAKHIELAKDNLQLCAECRVS